MLKSHQYIYLQGSSRDIQFGGGHPLVTVKLRGEAISLQPDPVDINDSNCQDFKVIDNT